MISALISIAALRIQEQYRKGSEEDTHIFSVAQCLFSKTLDKAKYYYYIGAVDEVVNVVTCCDVRLTVLINFLDMPA